MDRNNLRRLGAAIKEARQELDLSQEKLAELAGLHRTYIGSIERGERNVSILNLLRIARALNVRVVELLGTINERDSR